MIALAVNVAAVATSHGNGTAGGKCPFASMLESLPPPPRTKLPADKVPLTLPFNAKSSIIHDIIDGAPVVQGPFRGLEVTFAGTLELAKQVLNSEGKDNVQGFFPHTSKQASNQLQC